MLSMMKFRLISVSVLVMVVVAALPLASAQQKLQRKPASVSMAKSTFKKDVVDFTTKFCAGCHTAPNGADNVNLPKDVKEADAKVKYAKLYRKLAKYAGSKAMPPKGATQPKDAERNAFTGWVKKNVK